MLTLKALHISLVVAWFAGLFHTCQDLRQSGDGAAGQCRRTRAPAADGGKALPLRGPLGVLAVATGLWLWFGYGFSGGWLHLKTALVALLVIYHWHCGRLLKSFQTGSNAKEPCLVPFLQRDAGAGTFCRGLLVVLKPF